MLRRFQTADVSVLVWRSGLRYEFAEGAQDVLRVIYSEYKWGIYLDDADGAFYVVGVNADDDYPVDWDRVADWGWKFVTRPCSCGSGQTVFVGETCDEC